MITSELIQTELDKSISNRIMNELDYTKTNADRIQKICALVNARVFQGRLIKKTSVYKSFGISIKEGNEIYNQILSYLFPELNHLLSVKNQTRLDQPCFYIKGFAEKLHISDEEVMKKAFDFATKFNNCHKTQGMDPILLGGAALYLAEKEPGNSIDTYKDLGFSIQSTISTLRKKKLI